MLTITQEIGDHVVGYEGVIWVAFALDKLLGDFSAHTQHHRNSFSLLDTCGRQDVQYSLRCGFQTDKNVTDKYWESHNDKMGLIMILDQTFKSCLRC